MSKFKPGDVVEVIDDYDGSKQFGCGHIGEIGTVLRVAKMQNTGSGRVATVNVLDIKPAEYPGTVLTPDTVVAYEDHMLRLIDDEDGDDCYEKAEWDDDLFVPRTLTVKEEN